MYRQPIAWTPRLLDGLFAAAAVLLLVALLVAVYGMLVPFFAALAATPLALLLLSAGALGRPAAED
jgi:hypothetical protein